MTEQWRELKETITEMRDNGGTGTQQDVCKFLVNLMETLEKQIQQPCEDTEVIKVSKGAVKARQGRFVIYDVDWLKENFYTTEEKIYGQPKQPCEDAVSRQAVIDKATSWDTHFADSERYVSLSDIMALPPVTPPTSEDIKEAYLKGYDYGVKDWFKSKTQPCEDAVSRQAVINTIFYKSDNSCDVVLSTDLMDRIKHLPSVTPQASEEDIHREREQAYMLGYEDASKKFRTEPSEDCISRKQALDDKGLAVFHRYDDYVKMRNYLKTLPSVTPERPKGEWIRITNGAMREKYICSECGRQIEEDGIEELIAIKYPYCHCGAEMEGEVI